MHKAKFCNFYVLVFRYYLNIQAKENEKAWYAVKY
jgi:hypothetical protein